MCEPIAIATIVSVGATVVGGIVSAKGAADKGAADNRYFRHLAAVDEGNITEVQKTGEYERRAITESASREMQSNKVQTAQLTGQQNVAIAASGIGGGSVTAMDIARDTINKSTLDEMFIRYNADTQKYLSAKKERQDVKNLRERAKGYRMGGEAAKAAAGMDVAGIALSTASQTANTYLNYRRG